MNGKDAFQESSRGVLTWDAFGRRVADSLDLRGASEADIEALSLRISGAERSPEFMKHLLKKICDLQTRNAELEEHAQKDALTGLFNRRAYDVILEHEIRRAEREVGYKGPSVLYGDMSLFKSINDTYGHKAGDLALQKVAEKLKDCCRKSDIVARVGGDEFAAILPDCSIEEAEQVKARIEKSFAHFSFSYGVHSLRVGINLCLAEYKLGETADTLTMRADELMLAAKKADPYRRGPGYEPERHAF